MANPRYVTPWMTRNQAQVIIDALDLYTEGTQGQQTQRELRDATAARKKLIACLVPALQDSGEGDR